ncbi:hypothetical protein GQ457_10G026620 [Hibiscus cannabinus]
MAKTQVVSFLILTLFVLSICTYFLWVMENAAKIFLTWDLVSKEWMIKDLMANALSFVHQNVNLPTVNLICVIVLADVSS